MLARLAGSTLAAVGACWAAAFVWSPTAAFYIAMWAAVHAIGVGIPLFFVISATTTVTWLSALIGGMIAATLPFTAWTLLWVLGLDSSINALSSVGSEQSHADIIDGVPTVYFWLRHLQLCAPLALFGAIGGVAFWSVWRSRGA